jgi:cytochrome c556
MYPPGSTIGSCSRVEGLGIGNQLEMQSGARSAGASRGVVEGCGSFDRSGSFAQSFRLILAESEFPLIREYGRADSKRGDDNDFAHNDSPLILSSVNKIRATVTFLSVVNVVTGQTMKLSARKLGIIVFAALAGIAIGAEDAPPEHKQWMKDLGNQNGALRKGIDVEKNAAAMQETMKHVYSFWQKRNSEIGVKTSNDTIAGATQIAKASGDKEAVSAGMKMVGAGCKGCHDQHREKISDTEYKIK